MEQENKREKRLSRGAIIGIAAVVALLAVLAVWLVRPGIILTAEKENSEGIAPDTAFLLKVPGSPEQGELRGRIAMEPELSWDLIKQEDGSWRILPLKPLEAGTELTVRVDSRTFRFRVRHELVVTSAFPAPGAVRVPVDSGIEFTFNSPDMAQSIFEEGFSITPHVQGNFNSYSGRFVFYPEEWMDYSTEYTVVLSDSMQSTDGARLPQPYTLTFTTAAEGETEREMMFQLSGNGSSINSLASESPMLQIYLDANIPESQREVDVTLYAFEGWEEYYRQMRENLPTPERHYMPQISVDLEHLTEYASFRLTPFKAQAVEEGYDNGRWILQFPDTLPEGWYAVELSMEIEGYPVSHTMFLQVSDLSIFYMAMVENMLVWVNDAATGLPVEGAEIRVEGNYHAQGTTGPDGTVYITNAEAPADQEALSNKTVFVVSVGDRVFVDMDSYYTVYNDHEEKLARSYMSYLHSDRPIYRTTDTIRVWGMVRPRDPEAPMPETVTLSLRDDAVTREVPVQPGGTFTAEIAYESISSGYAWLNMKLGDGELRSLYLEIEDYVKPVYTATLTHDKPIYLLTGDNTVRAELEVSLFDGTPVSSFGVQQRTWSDGIELDESALLTTDRNGVLRTTARITGDDDSWYPRYYSHNFSSTDAQQENFWLEGSIYAIHRDVMLQAHMTENDPNALRVTTHRIDVSGVTLSGYSPDTEELRGQPLSQEVTAVINRVWYEKIVDGTYYDFISRTMKESYRYEEREEVLETRTFTTQNGEYLLEDLPAFSREESYRVDLITRDSLNRRVLYTAHMGPLYGRYAQNDGVHRYELQKKSAYGPGNVVNYGDMFSLEMADYRFEDGEDITVELLDNDETVDRLEGRLLYVVVQDDYSGVGITENASVTIPFREKLVPNYLLTGAYFDGSHIFALENTYLHFNADKRELEVTLSTDEAQYRPADTVEVSAVVTEKATGRPAANAEVILSVVDEAIFSMREQNIQILDTLYESVYYPYVRKYTSYLQFDFGGPGEKGGGGGGEMRVDFQDTAHFQVLRTDDQGRAGFTVSLPDNITTWRLTALSLTDNNFAGSTKTGVAATKEFFVVPVLAETLLAGDTLSVGAYGAGVGVTEADTVRYTVTLSGGGQQETRQMESPLRDYALADLGSLPVGDYTVTIEGSCGDYRDGVQLPVSVVSSGIELSLVRSFNLADGIHVEPLRYPVSISFYGEGAKTWNSVLRNVSDDSGAGRADARIAAKYVAHRSAAHGGEWYDNAALEADLSDLDNRIISLMPYGQEDLELTVKARLAAPNQISPGGVRSIVRNRDWLDEYSGSRTILYLAQALAGETVTADLNYLLESDGGLDYVEKLYLIMALWSSGETETAVEWYNRLVTPYLNSLTGISGMTALYVEPENPGRTAEDCTAVASMLATMLETDHREGLVLYLSEKRSAYEPYLWEQMYYLTCNDPHGDDSLFSYKQGGRITREVDRVTTISFNREQLAEADFRVETGTVYADVYYAGSPDDAMDKSRRLIGLTKTVEPVGDGLRTGELVKITLTPDFTSLDTQVGEARLVMDDYIPTGMRFELLESLGEYQDETGETDPGWYLSSRQGQRIEISVYGAGDPALLKPIVYYARCATPGDYVVESAYVNSATADIWGQSARSTVTIES